ncbi:MAG: hypothetical protein R3B13_19120 [Polyangiaceae bacterium]
MTWSAVDLGDEAAPVTIELDHECLRVARGASIREFALDSARVGVAKWVRSPPGAVLVLGDGQPLRIGAVGAHYRYESREPCSEVDATLTKEEFQDLMSALQAAWKARYDTGGGYRVRRDIPNLTRQYFDLYRVSRWVAVFASGLVLGVAWTLLGWKQLLSMLSLAFAGISLLVVASLRLAAELQLRRPSYALEIVDGLLRVRRGKKTLGEAPLGSMKFAFDVRPDEATIVFPDGRNYRLISRRRTRYLPLGFFPPADVLFIDPETLPLLRAAVSDPAPEAPADGRFRVPDLRAFEVDPDAERELSTETDESPEHAQPRRTRR